MACGAGGGHRAPALLERRLGPLARRITELEHQERTAKEELDIEAFVSAWLPTVEAKRQFYAQFYQDVRQLFSSFQTILRQHDAQVDGIMQLPPRIQRYLLDAFLPDRYTVAARLAENMLAPQAWRDILCQLGPLQVRPPEQLMSNDPGCKPLPPRLIQNALNQGRPIERSA